MILKGKKVILRPIRMADAPRFVKWFNDPDVNKFLQIRKMDLAQEKKWIKELPKHARTEKVFAIDTKEGAHIGSVGLHKINYQNRKCTFGIMVGDRAHWNLGCGSEAAALAVNYAFQKLRLNRVELGVYSYNPRAVKVYRRLGFKLEGTKRQHNFYKGKFHDTFVMGLLKSEWKRKVF